MNREFESAVREAVAVYLEIYGATLLAVCVTGSVHRGEAVLGLSDLDMSAWVSVPAPPEAHERFYQATKARLARWAPATSGVVRARTADWLAAAWPEGSEEMRARTLLRWCRAREAGVQPDADVLQRVPYEGCAFAFRYDATRVYGEDHLADLRVPEPDAMFARLFVHGPLETVRLVSSGQEHREFPLPNEPVARLRKLGRLAVLLGACVLMACGRFRSLRGADVLPALDRCAPRWSAFLQDTTRCYVRVLPDAPEYASYLASLVEFAEWAWHEVDAAWPASQGGAP
jgi:hypothetical protein